MMLNKQQTLLSQRRTVSSVPSGRALITKSVVIVAKSQQRRSTAVIVASLTRRPEDAVANGASTAPHRESDLHICIVYSVTKLGGDT